MRKSAKSGGLSSVVVIKWGVKVGFSSIIALLLLNNFGFWPEILILSVVFRTFLALFCPKWSKIREIRENPGKIRENSGFFCKKPPDEALFGARDEKFGQNPLYGHRSQIFGFYCIFITKYFTK